MAYTALYREWRPRFFDDVVGQKHITVTLRNQIVNDRIAHAYLFCGTRGTGKTSTAKILSKAVNCLNLSDGEPCNQCEMCKKINAGIAIDVTELDAASNNGVDKIRDIIEDVQYPPQEARFKVYIIDEVHMLSMGAVNAFLKTLEEPPKNVVFILATTDPQKLPITILSRCQRFDFKRISSAEIFDRLREIVKNQGVFAEDKSLNLIARMSDGAMRDALSILDQAISMGNGHVNYDNVINMLGLVTNDNLIKLADSIFDKKVEESLKLVDEIVLNRKDIYTFIKDMITHMRNLMMIKISKNPEEVLDMSNENIELLKVQAQKTRVEEIMRHIRILQEAEEQSKWSKQSRIYLELAIVKMCKIEYDTSNEIILSRLNKMEEVVRRGEIVVTCDTPQNAQNPSGAAVNNQRVNRPVAKKETSRVPVQQLNPNSKLNIDMVKKSWKDVLEVIKGKRAMIVYASLLTGEPDACQGGVIDIKYSEEYGFNKIRLEKDDNKAIVEAAFSEIFREPIKVRYTVDKKEEKSNVSTEDMLIQTFGEELVEIIDE